LTGNGQRFVCCAVATLPFPVPRLDSIDFERMTITYGDAGSNAEDLYPIYASQKKN